MMEVNITVRCASVCFLYQFVVVELVLGLNWAGLDVNVERKYLFCAESTGSHPHGDEAARADRPGHCGRDGTWRTS